MSTQANAPYAFIGAFVDELARAGVAQVCICPGSRSTPLALAFAHEPRIRLFMHLDERSAAFFALGMAKASGVPVALVCTSGTAAANFMPAVVEARQARVPLLVLTADRPPELRDCGAPQTIDQIRFYGTQVKWSVEMPLPEATETLLRFARTTAVRAVAAATEEAPGPVHLNFPLREPLVPSGGTILPVPDRALYGRVDGLAYARVLGGQVSTVDDQLVERYAGEIGQAPYGLIVCGPMERGEQLAEAIVVLARAIGYPILADPLSGLRCGQHDRSLVIDSYDAFLRDERFTRSAAPRIVLRFGAMPTAKPLLQYLQRYPDARQILIDPAGWRDPSLLAAEVLRADPAAFCLKLAAKHGREANSAWVGLWQEVHRRTRQRLDREIAAIEEPFEGRVMAELATLLPAGATLFAGNSMPVRDIDTFFHGSERTVRIMGNRGASGIDGVTSTALGVAALRDGPVVLAIGDVSFYHDMNGLLAAKQHRLNLTVVLLNNDGGGIFSFLPQADLPADAAGDPFETLFGTPHGLDFASAATLYGATYTRIRSWDEFRSAVQTGMAAGGLHIVEVPSNRARNVDLHRRLWPAVSAAIAGVAG